MRRKKMAPKIVTSVLLLAAEFENRLRTLDPAGNVAITIKMRADTTSAHPERYPRIGWMARRTHE
jgi:hypothetical protein